MASRKKFPSIQLQADHHKPLFVQFADALRSLVLSGQLSRGEQLPALKELADLANVSIYTADRGIQGLIQEGILVRRPKKGTYVRGNTAREESTDSRWDRSTRKVILCVHPASGVCPLPNCYRGLIGLGIQAAAAEAGADLVTTSHTALEENIRFYQGQGGFQLLGVIFSDFHSDRFSRLTKQHPQLHFVLANARPADFELTLQNVRGVFSDDFGAAYEMASWAIGRQHGRVAIFSRWVGNENYRQRVEGFIAAARDRGVGISEELIAIDRKEEGNLTLGRAYMRRLLDSESTPPALILCVNDELARGAILEMEQCDQASHTFITGFDGLQLPAAPERAFPTVEVDFLGIGRRSAELLSRADFQALPKVIAIPGKLIPNSLQSLTEVS